MSSSEICPHPTTLPGTVLFAGSLRSAPRRLHAHLQPCRGRSLALTQLSSPPALGDYFSSPLKHPHYRGDT